MHFSEDQDTTETSSGCQAWEAMSTLQWLMDIYGYLELAPCPCCLPSLHRQLRPCIPTFSPHSYQIVKWHLPAHVVLRIAGFLPLKQLMHVLKLYANKATLTALCTSPQGWSLWPYLVIQCHIHTVVLVASLKWTLISCYTSPNSSCNSRALCTMSIVALGSKWMVKQKKSL